MKKLLSLLLSLALCLSILPTAAFAAEGSGNTDSTKKISVRMNAKNGKSTDAVSDGGSKAYGTTHTLTVTPRTLPDILPEQIITKQIQRSISTVK